MADIPAIPLDDNNRPGAAMLIKTGGVWAEWDGLLKHTLDFIADIEIGGEAITVTTYDNTCNGSDQAIVAVGAGDKMKLYKLTLQVASDLTGSVTIKLGSVSIGKIVNPKAGGQYMLISALPDFVLGALGADLIMNGTSGAVATIN